MKKTKADLHKPGFYVSWLENQAGKAVLGLIRVYHLTGSKFGNRWTQTNDRTLHTLTWTCVPSLEELEPRKDRDHFWKCERFDTDTEAFDKANELWRAQEMVKP